MALFGKPKESTANKDLQDIKKAVDIRLPTREELEKESRGPMAQQPRPVRQQSEPSDQQAKPSVAPIFIKLDKYNTILSTLSDIRKGLEAVKNVFSYISELEKMKSESFRMLHDMFSKIDKNLAYLDSEFLKPPGFEFQTSSEIALEPGNLENMLDEMKGRIDQLRSQIENIY